MWRPGEIIIHEKVSKDPSVQGVLEKCPQVPRRYVKDAKATTVSKASHILQSAKTSMLDTMRAGKQVLFLAPAGSQPVDQFTMPDERIVCPNFDRLKLASNGCYYQCDWCYLKLTYRAAFPFITARVQYDRIARRIEKRLASSRPPRIFNSGELADSLALEPLTGAARWFIPWFAGRPNAYLFMLTKSDHVDAILDLRHNGHTIIAWSLNNARISRKFEIGAPCLQRRINAAQKAQEAGYPLRLRLDPIVPVEGWKKLYAETIAQIFAKLRPERITLGTLRFEEAFYNMRHSLFTTGPELPRLMEQMEPMLPPREQDSTRRPKSGKYSFNRQLRSEIFSFAAEEIRRYSDCRLALCKETAEVWRNVGLEPSRCACVCQLDAADMSGRLQ